MRWKSSPLAQGPEVVALVELQPPDQKRDLWFQCSWCCCPWRRQGSETEEMKHIMQITLRGLCSEDHWVFQLLLTHFNTMNFCIPVFIPVCVSSALPDFLYYSKNYILTPN